MRWGRDFENSKMESIYFQGRDLNIFSSPQNVIFSFPQELIKLKPILRAEGLGLTATKNVSNEADLCLAAE